MSKTKVFISDVAGSHYRACIFTLLDKHYDISWNFGAGDTSIAKLDDSLLHSVRRVKSTKIISNLYWQKGIVSSLFRKYDYYVIPGALYSLSAWTFIILNKLFFRKKVFLWSHGWYGRENGIRRFLKSKFFTIPSGAFFYGNYAKEVMQKEGLSTQNIHVIHNSLDYDRQLGLRAVSLSENVLQKHFANNNPNLIFIGRLTNSKKLDMVIEAAARLKRDNLNVNITFVGDGESKPVLMSLAKKHDIPCWLYGACYDEEMNAKLIASAEICVSPGNVGLTAIHAMMFGCPVISHDDFTHQGPEFEAITPGQTGEFFKADDTDSLAQAIKSWISIHTNRDEVRQKCYKEIDTSWNPEYQLRVFSEVIPLES